MRVLLANSTCKVGGVSSFMLSLRRCLVAAGHECELFFFEHGPMERNLPADVPVRFGSLADCLTYVDGHDIDVVHANNVDWPTGIAAVRALGVPLVVTAHKVRVNGTYGWTRANCDGFATVARWIAADLQPFTDLALETIPNGVDIARFAPGPPQTRERGPIVAWVGRAGSLHKRLDLFAA